MAETSFHAAIMQAWSAFADEFVSVWDASARQMIYCNDSYSQIFGYADKNEFSSAYSFFGFRKHPLNKELENLVMNTIEGNGQWTEEVLFNKRNGDVFLGRLDVAVFTDKGQKCYLQRIINIDTQRVFSENLFREVKKFEALFQYATLPIIVANRKGQVMMANAQSCAMFGYSVEELTAMKVEELIPDRFRAHHTEHRRRYDEHPENRPMGRGMQLKALRKGGHEFPVEISLGHYMIEEEPFVIAFIIDITQRTEIENRLLSQKEELEKVNHEIEVLNEELEHKVEMRTQELTEALSKERELSDLKSRFVSMASHEFRTPLSTILSSISLIGKYTGSEEQDKRDKHIHRIRSAVSNLTDILNEFLSLGRIEEGRVQLHNSNFNLKEQLQLIIHELNPIVKNGQHIIYHHHGDVMAELDVSLLRNIMINLVSNAIKFSGEKATIWVESRNEDHALTIKVKDEGLGIPEEDMKHLFERFFRGKNVINIQGTGLGLHIVSRYVELMGGGISVDSELERGTTFTIKFNT